MTATADRPYRTGRPPITSRAALLEVARGVPLDQLTIGEVAARAGVKYSTFYRHLTSVDALRSAVADQILTEADWPDPAGPWRHYVDQVAATLSRLVVVHPGLSRLLAGLAERPPRLQAERDWVRAALVDAGFDPVHAAVGADSIIATALLDGDDVNGHAGRLVVAGLAAQRGEAA